MVFPVKDYKPSISKVSNRMDKVIAIEDKYNSSILKKSCKFYRLILHVMLRIQEYKLNKIIRKV